METILPAENDREHFYTILKQFRTTLDLDQLLADLRQAVTCPERIPLYEAVRPLVPLKYQMEYDSRALRIPPERLRVVRLLRQSHESLGFAVRGGLEHGVGIYVSAVAPDSLAWRQGLRVGDQLVRINGFTVDQALHEEVLGLVRSRPELVLKVRRVGMLPQRPTANEPVSWRHAVTTGTGRALESIGDCVFEDDSDPVIPADADPENEVDREARLFINMEGSSSLGCSICSGLKCRPSFVCRSTHRKS